MMINKNNYEEYLVDYAEGMLTDVEAKEVEAFLAANPDAAAELEAFTTVKLQPEPVKFFNKESLYREKAAEPRIFKLGAVLKYSAAVAAAAAIIIVLLVWNRSSQEAAPMPGVAQEHPASEQLHPEKGSDATAEKSSQTPVAEQQQMAAKGEAVTKGESPSPVTAEPQKKFTKQVKPQPQTPVQVAVAEPLPYKELQVLPAHEAMPAFASIALKPTEPVPAPVEDNEERGIIGGLLANLSGTLKLGRESSITIDRKRQEEKTLYTFTFDTPVLFVSQSFKAKQ